MRPKARTSDPSQGTYLAPMEQMGAVNSEASGNSPAFKFRPQERTKTKARGDPNHRISEDIDVRPLVGISLRWLKRSYFRVPICLNVQQPERTETCGLGSSRE